MSGTAGPARPAGNYRWVVCALLFGATTINYVDRGVLGVLAGRIVYSVVNMTQVTQGFLVNFTLYPQSIATCVIASIAVGLLAGGWPALRSANMSVVDGLRRVV